MLAAQRRERDLLIAFARKPEVRDDLSPVDAQVALVRQLEEDVRILDHRIGDGFIIEDHERI